MAKGKLQKEGKAKAAALTTPWDSTLTKIENRRLQFQTAASTAYDSFNTALGKVEDKQRELDLKKTLLPIAWNQYLSWIARLYSATSPAEIKDALDSVLYLRSSILTINAEILKLASDLLKAENDANSKYNKWHVAIDKTEDVRTALAAAQCFADNYLKDPAVKNAASAGVKLAKKYAGLK